MTTPLFTSSILGKGQTWVNADGSGAKKDLTAAATGNGMLIAAVIATNTDTASYKVALYLNDGSTDLLIGTVSVPASAGNDASVASANLLSPTMVNGLAADGSLAIPSGWRLKGAVTTTVTSAKAVTAVCNAGQL